MKKSLLALAALTAFAGAASAQSSVTLFGVVDVSARAVKNGNTGDVKSLATDGMGSSRLGFRGVEDLGGGLRAGFWIEGSLQADTGNAGGQTWQRRSTVSLMGNFGELRLGRDYTPDFWNHTVFDPFGTNGVASSLNVYTPAGSGDGTSVRANNTIGYFLPAMGGIYGQVQVAAGEGAAGNKHAAGRIGYAGGPFNIAIAYGKSDVDVAQTVEFERMNLGASYNMGFATLMGQYIKGETSGGASNGREIQNYLIGGIIPFGQSQFKISYVKSEGDGPTAAMKNADAEQIGVGYLYSLSKRTTMYAHYARIDNKSGASYFVGGAPAVAGSNGGGALAAGQKSTGYEFGVNHTF